MVKNVHCYAYDRVSRLSMASLRWHLGGENPSNAGMCIGYLGYATVVGLKIKDGYLIFNVCL